MALEDMPFSSSSEWCNFRGFSRVFSSPVRRYRKSYCNHPGVGDGVCVGVRVAQMLKFLIKVFISLYLLWMDQADTLYVSRYWSEVLFSTIMTHPG